MFHRVVATVLFVRDLARCMTFYRDTLGLQVQESTPDFVSFHMENLYFLLLEVPPHIRLGCASASMDRCGVAWENRSTSGLLLLRAVN
jgi:catechol 2,3-dioxygenase-like lactoylglutathione lyase family enzyme